MTFDDDVLRFRFEGGYKTLTCRQAGIEWPPPMFLEIYGIRMRRNRQSTLTDAQRSQSKHLVRGAEYVIDRP